MSAASPVAPGAASNRVEIDAALRRRVDALLAAAEHERSAAGNYAQRADVVWAWANALAQRGVAIPPDLPFVIALLRWAEADGGRVEPIPGIDLPIELQLAQLDGYIVELASLERGVVPGRLRLVSREPLVSRGWTTVQQIFTVEDTPIAAGGALMVGSLGVDASRPQHSDPAAPGYLTARASRSDVVLEPITVPWNGVDSSIIAVVPLPAFRVKGGSLERGDTVTFTFGDRAQGSPGLRVPALSIDQFQLPVYVDPNGSGHFQGLECPNLEIVGQPEVTAVRVLAPSIVEPGERFAITVRSEDDAMNRASGEVPAYEVLVDGAVVARLAAGRDSVATVGNLSLDRAGVHRLAVRSTDGRVSAWSNPVWVREAPTLRILWGDTHGHTGLSEGQGSARSFFEYARQDARLDFVTLSEHDLWMDDGEWSQLQSLASEFDTPGRFAAILGYEWTAFSNRGGHHNVFFRDSESERVGVQDASRLSDLYRELRSSNDPEDVLVIPHAHMAGDWRRSDPGLERLVELYSEHGSFEWFANAYLRQGWQVGFVGAGDDHRAKPGLAPPSQGVVAQPGGLAAVLASDATADSIFSALRALRTYATSGQRIVLDASLNGRPMGTRQPATALRELRCRVHGTAPIERIDVVRDGAVVHSRSYLTARLGASSMLEVAFESSTEVFGPEHDSPRGNRLWRGTLEVEGARIAGVRPVGLDNPLRERVRTAPGAPDRVEFSLITRGRADSFLLELEGAGPATTLRFHLEPASETGAPSTLRGQIDLPAAGFTMRLGDLVDSRLRHQLPMGNHVDSVSIQVVEPDGALDRTFEYADLDGEGAGYYYVRVTQLDGGRAWSSPWWVGERGPR